MKETDVNEGKIRLSELPTDAEQVASVFCALDELSRGVTLNIPVREAIEQGRD